MGSGKSAAVPVSISTKLRSAGSATSIDGEDEGEDGSGLDESNRRTMRVSSSNQLASRAKPILVSAPVSGSIKRRGGEPYLE